MAPAEHIYVLRSTHYSISGSIGIDSKIMAPFITTLDTGSGFNLIRSAILPANAMAYVTKEGNHPPLADANGNPLLVEGVIPLRLRLGNAEFSVHFYVCPTLSVDILIGTEFANTNIKAIWCMDQKVTLRDGTTIPILSTHRPNCPNSINVATFVNEDQRLSSSNAIRLAKYVKLPPSSQTYVKVTTKMAGLVEIEPKSVLFSKRGIRPANGIAEVYPARTFTVLLANTSSRPYALPKNAVVGYALRPDHPVYTPEKNELRSFSNVLNISQQDATYDPPGKEQAATVPPVKPVRIPTYGKQEGMAQAQQQKRVAEPNPDWRTFVDLSHVHDSSLRRDILQMLERHEGMWTPGKLGEINITEHRIELQPGIRPIRSQPYRQGPATRELVAKNVREMIEANVIEPAQSEWASPIVFAPKKDGTLRFCVDYRKLNAATIADTYPLPRIDDCLDSLGDATIFTTLDANSGYWQVPVAHEDRDKTTFTTFMGTFRHKRMPFGLRNAPATFQRALDMILSGVRWQTCLVYIDDVIIFSRNVEDHLHHVDEVLTLLRRAGVSLKLKKCDFFRDRVSYLGHVVTPGKLSVATETSKAFEEVKFPENITQLRSFLGAANVYRRFVKDFSKIAKPLSAMTQKDAKPNWSSPTKPQLDAFETLRDNLITPPVLALPKPGRPFLIDTDASAYQLGAVLLQQQDETNPNDYVPIGYFSKTLSDTECNYSTTERECFAVVWALLTLRPYIEGTRFLVRTDHNALKWLMTLTDPSGRLTRWRLRLSEFDYEIVYRPGRKHQVPDALSRLVRPGLLPSSVDDDIPTFGDHNNIMITTRSGAKATNASSNSGSTKTAVTNVEPDQVQPSNEEDDNEDLDEDTFAEFILDDDYHDDDEPEEEFSLDDYVRAVNLPTRIPRHELLAEQRNDAFCQKVLTRQSKRLDSLFFEDNDGLLKRRTKGPHPYIQTVVPFTLRDRLLKLSHEPPIAGHPGETRMFETLRMHFYWPHMAADVHWYVRNCRPCAKKRSKYRKTKRLLKLFPATVPLESIAIDILGPLTRTRKKNRYLLVISDRFTKLTQVVSLPRINAYTVAVAFCEAWVFKYGAPRSLLSDNGKQFVAQLFQSVCKILGVSNIFTATYHPQTNGQVERYNRTILSMLRNYVNEHQSDWDEYVSALTYAYNTHVHRTTKTTPFSLVLSREPPPYAAYHSIRSIRKNGPNDGDSRRNFRHRLDVAISNARINLHKMQERYKKDFDKHVHKRTFNLEPGDYVFIDPRNARVPGQEKRNKLQHNLLGPYEVLRVNERNVVIQRDDLVETVNVDRVIYTPSNEATRTRRPQDATPQDLAEKNLEGDTWLVEKILQHRQKNDTYEFLIKWENDDRTTWEPRRNIPEELVSHYFATRNER